MAKLYFRYGAMGSSKSANILMVRYNYEERGQYAVLLKPRTDSRDGERKIQSRMGLSASAEYVDEFLKEISTIWKKENTEYRYQPAVFQLWRHGAVHPAGGDGHRPVGIPADEAYKGGVVRPRGVKR